MSKLSLWRRLAIVCLALIVSACGGAGSSSAPPAGGIVATPGNGQVTIAWQASPGVQYWLMYAATASAIDMKNPPAGHVWATNITSPYVLTGLVNGTTYSFAMNARTDGGPGGTQSASVSAVPRYAGASWTAGNALGSNDLRGLAYGTASDATVDYLAVGTAGAMYKGTDGASWSAITTGPSIAFKAATYAFSKFVAVGANGAANNIYYSSDLSNWTAATTAVGTGLNALASNGSTLVAVGDSGKVFYSADAITWTAASGLPAGLTANLNAVAYSSGNSTWVAVGAGGVVLTSTDGNTWTAVAASNAGGNDLNGVTVTTGSVFVAVGNGGTVIRSSDGTNWSAQTLGASSTLFAVSTDSAQFLAIGAGGAAFTSVDGISWAKVVSGSTNNLYAIAGSTSGYVVVGQSGTNLVSK